MRSLVSLLVLSGGTDTSKLGQAQVTTSGKAAAIEATGTKCWAGRAFPGTVPEQKPILSPAHLPSPSHLLYIPPVPHCHFECFYLLLKENVIHRREVRVTGVKVLWLRNKHLLHLNLKAHIQVFKKQYINSNNFQQRATQFQNLVAIRTFWGPYMLLGIDPPESPGHHLGPLLPKD